MKQTMKVEQSSDTARMITENSGKSTVQIEKEQYLPVHHLAHAQKREFIKAMRQGHH